jgi:hypothetical protein
MAADYHYRTATWCTVLEPETVKYRSPAFVTT